ncbi:GNAT family N-acetyltransferase [Pseudaestuariivita atlantica]|uniref:N-acetyltransferase domain-containing protein n=1 Tax=Pseudaestuariivita atlantica TaxID=1317121 RepID=A0A0L1JRS7_9RHOB|nr:GNAT family N-acetyltransferase [Pseudaestuariivita atlantica]KNG94494.1 hypothetical protein ATO11_03480 [Pseudaestuariivita atlantica]
MRYACETPTGGKAPAMAATVRATIPALDTTRLHLRAPRVEDFACYAKIVCGERGQYVGGPMSREDAWFDFLSLASGWMLHGHGGWTVTSRDTGAPLGFVVLGMEPGDLEPELGFLFLPEGEGQGFAHEAAAAARDFARATLELPALVSYIDTGNTRSVALANRLGATDEGPFDGQPDFHTHRHWGPAA